MSLFTRKRIGRRVPPVEYADAVERWARAKGTHALLVWDHHVGNWDVKIELKPNDPRNVLDDPTETVPLLKPGTIYRANGQSMPGLVGVELDDIGVQGILDHLNEWNLETGRYRSAEEMIRHTHDDNTRLRERERAYRKDEARYRGRYEYGRAMGHPVVPGTDLLVADTESAAQQEE